MRRLYGYDNIRQELRDPVAAIGMFDGIHLGHRRVINKVLRAAGKDRDAAVITFDPHPQSVIDPRKAPPRIMSLEHRLHIFEKMKLDAAVVIKFTGGVSSMGPEDFVDKVISGMGARTVFVGSNFRFGSGKSGDVKLLKDIGGSRGIDVFEVKPVKMGGRVISSTWLRKLISSGDIAKAEKLLRRPPSVLGTVVEGDRRGRSLGLPTANIDPHQEVIPPPGVYAVKVELGGKLFNGALNIGFKPTFYGSKLKKRKEPSAEVHVIDYDGSLYGKTLEIFFIKALRKEKHFRTEKELVFQVRKDMERARQLLSSKRTSEKIRKYKDI
ncbi:MAG: bifunctional riboflavin kinase/FAD synthetase [Candidatus Omnitrophica bacterium]|nr:bifunctional riboflavin kinase/FAD synthetase [Candidatus Omnitrophota bacterium]